MGGCLGQRAGLMRPRCGLVDLGLETRLLDRAVPSGLGLERGGDLLLFGRLPIGLGLGDPRLGGHGGDMRTPEVLDVAGGVVDLLNLQGVDDQAEFLHLRAGTRPGQGRQLLPIPDHILDGELADHRPEMTGEHIVHPGFHLVLLVEEPSGGIGDRGVIVPDLEDHYTAHTHGDSLLGDAVDAQLGGLQVQGEATDILSARHDQDSLPGHNLETEAFGHGIVRVPVCS